VALLTIGYAVVNEVAKRRRDIASIMFLAIFRLLCQP
jgi:hypothetical protein